MLRRWRCPHFDKVSALATAEKNRLKKLLDHPGNHRLPKDQITALRNKLAAAEKLERASPRRHRGQTKVIQEMLFTPHAFMFQWWRATVEGNLNNFGPSPCGLSRSMSHEKAPLSFQEAKVIIDKLGALNAGRNGRASTLRR